MLGANASGLAAPKKNFPRQQTPRLGRDVRLALTDETLAEKPHF
jgi:hypothetical protein